MIGSVAGSYGGVIIIVVSITVGRRIFGISGTSYGTIIGCGISTIAGTIGCGIGIIAAVSITIILNVEGCFDLASVTAMVMMGGSSQRSITSLQFPHDSILTGRNYPRRGVLPPKDHPQNSRRQASDNIVVQISQEIWKIMEIMYTSNQSNSTSCSLSNEWDLSSNE